MKVPFTVFEILSLIFQKLKRSRDNGHAPFGDNLSSVGGWDLLCSMFNPHIKFEMSTITCNKEMKGNVWSHPLGP